MFRCNCIMFPVHNSISFQIMSGSQNISKADNNTQYPVEPTLIKLNNAKH